MRVSLFAGSHTFPNKLKTHLPKEAIMIYQERLPHPALRPYIHMYGVLNEERTFTESQVEHVPPSVGKGLVFYLNPNHPVNVNNGTYKNALPPGFILPQGTRANVWTHKGGFQTFAVIFKPGMCRMFFPFPLIEYLNSVLQFEDLDDPDCLNYYESVHLAGTMEERFRLSDSFFLNRLRNIQTKEDLSAFAIRRIQDDLNLKLSDLSSELRISERHFRRIFTREIGIQPKQYQKIVRINAALARLSSPQFTNKTDVAYQCGYYDQAHFIENFREFTGLTPTEHLRRTASVTSSIHFREKVIDGLEIIG